MSGFDVQYARLHARHAISLAPLDPPKWARMLLAACDEMEEASRKVDPVRELQEALVAMVYVHPCNCANGVPDGSCARCRSVRVLGFDPAAQPVGGGASDWLATTTKPDDSIVDATGGGGAK